MTIDRTTSQDKRPSTGGGRRTVSHVDRLLLETRACRRPQPSVQMLPAMAQGLHLSLGVALCGDLTCYRGPSRSIGYRWFTDPASREPYHPDDHPFLTTMWVSGLREVVTLRGPTSRAAQLADLLLEKSEEFRRTWEAHQVGLRPGESKRLVHPELGTLELTCQTLVDPVQSHFLLVYTATPRSESHEKLELLSVIGQRHPRTDGPGVSETAQRQIRPER